MIEYLTVAETASTNDDLAGLDAAHEGLWLRAVRQTAGRGRQGRAWISPAGNLHASTVVRVTPGDPPAPTLALVAAVALHEALSAFAGGLTIKWPNDILDGEGAKVAGILLERHGDRVIVGCGANLAHHPDLPDRPTACLPGSPDPDVVVRALAEALARWLATWRGQGTAPVIARWSAHAHAPGAALTVRLPDGGATDGLFEGLDSDGALRLRLADGGRRVIHAGDVFLLRD